MRKKKKRLMFGVAVFIVLLSSAAASFSQSHAERGGTELLSVRGSAHQQQRIVNGLPVVPGVFPDIRYQASLVFENKSVCGGSFVSNNFVLTAAHCVDQRLDLTNLFVSSGLIPVGSTLYPVKNVWIHSEWDRKADGSLGYHDIALLELAITVDESVQIVPLAPADCTTCESRNAQYVASGFGVLVHDGEGRPQSLRYTFLEYAICPINFFPEPKGPQQKFSPITLCALYSANSSVPTDTCQGDSGGPLVQIVNGALLHQVGVVSGGEVMYFVLFFRAFSHHFFLFFFTGVWFAKRSRRLYECRAASVMDRRHPPR